MTTLSTVGAILPPTLLKKTYSKRGGLCNDPTCFRRTLPTIYPQGFKLDEDSSRIYLPKIGWVRYRSSRRTEGRAKQVTASLSAGRWYVSIQTER